MACCLSSGSVRQYVNFLRVAAPQADFDDQVVNNITDVDPGHQCYSIDRLEGITAGTNATIQLEYWSEFEGENNGNNQSFFACADIVSLSRVESCSFCHH
jgi:hypothetical protein